MLLTRIRADLQRQLKRLVVRWKRKLLGPRQSPDTPRSGAPGTSFRNVSELVTALLANRSPFRGMRSVYVLRRDTEG